MQILIHSALFEAIDGLLVLLLAVMLLFSGLHVAMIWDECRRCFPGQGGWWKCLRGMYFENKPSIALFVFTFGFLLRYGLLWHLRHAQNHGFEPDPLTRNVVALFIAANAVIVIGVVCWVRNISPFRIRNWQWLLAVAAAAAFSVWLAS